MSAREVLVERLVDAALLRLRPTTVKVFIAMRVLQRRAGTEPFPASAAAIAELTGLSEPTIVQGRHELLGAALIAEAKPASGRYILLQLTR